MIASEIFKYSMTGLFVLVTFYLSWVGLKKTKDLKGFAIGNKDMNPILVGITMAASISSTATFVINPGFVYKHGLSAYMHYGVAAMLGIFCAFFLITKGFRQIGEKNDSLTIPDWIFHRYGNRALSFYFALINLLSITFVVLILVGCSILMSSLFPVSQTAALTIILLFVFSYVLMGGTYAHAYTNTFQGILMLLIALFLFIHGLKFFDGGFFAALDSVSPHFGKLTNPNSNLYYDFPSVFLSGFVITFALMLQPHILSKVLYLKEDKDVRTFLITTVLVGSCFSLMLFIGFYAQLSGIEVARQDTVVTAYISQQFEGGVLGPYLLTFVSLTLLAAGMSTLDGILVALSSMVVNDIYLPLCGNKKVDHQRGLWLSRGVLIIIGIISYVLALNPPKLVGLFAQKGVYGLAAASLVPILFGVLYKKNISLKVITISSLIGLFGHLYLNIFGGILNPAVSATYAIIMSLFFTICFLLSPFRTIFAIGLQVQNRDALPPEK